METHVSRRAVLAAAAAPAALVSEVLGAETKERPRFLLVFHINLSPLSGQKAADFIRRTKKELTVEKPDGIHFVVLPFRGDEPSTVDVYSLDDAKWAEGPQAESNHAWLARIEKSILEPEVGWLYGDQPESDEEIVEFAKLMFGAPVSVLPPQFEEDAQAAVDLGRQYHVMGTNLRNFVIDILKMSWPKRHLLASVRRSIVP